MKITMLQTVEDSHPVIKTNEGTGKPEVKYQVDKFLGDQTYTVADDRGKKLIGFGYAKKAAKNA